MKTIKFDHRPYTEIPVIPHILKTNSDGSMDVVTDGAIEKGDHYNILPRTSTYVVQEVVETRPARGDWSGESYKGMAPTWSRIKSKLSHQ